MAAPQPENGYQDGCRHRQRRLCSAFVSSNFNQSLCGCCCWCCCYTNTWVIQLPNNPAQWLAGRVNRLGVAAQQSTIGLLNSRLDFNKSDVGERTNKRTNKRTEKGMIDAREPIELVADERHRRLYTQLCHTCAAIVAHKHWPHMVQNVHEHKQWRAETGHSIGMESNGKPPAQQSAAAEAVNGPILREPRRCTKTSLTYSFKNTHNRNAPHEFD